MWGRGGALSRTWQGQLGLKMEVSSRQKAEGASPRGFHQPLILFSEVSSIGPYPR